LIVIGAFLNPFFFYKTRDDGMFCADLYESAFQDVVQKMIKDREERRKIMMGVEAYKNKRGKFSSEMAHDSIDYLQPSIKYIFFLKLLLILKIILFNSNIFFVVSWWDSYGVLTPELKRIAIRILGLCCTASNCERNWSTFDFVMSIPFII
jgi:hypothetical protein